MWRKGRTGHSSKYSLDKWGITAKSRFEGVGKVGGQKITKRKHQG